MNSEFIKKIANAGIIAAVDTKEKAYDMIENGIGALETSDAEVIAAVHEKYPNVPVGYTVCDIDKAVGCGAEFIHVAVCCEKKISEIHDAGISVILSAQTIAEAAKAAKAGADIIEFAASDISGGVAMLGALSVATEGAKYIVSGAEKPLDYTVIPACIGWCDADIAKSEDVGAAARSAMYDSLALTLAHVGINAECEADSIEISAAYSKLLGIKHKVGNSSCFAGSLIEVMKKKYLGEHGHIAIGTKSLPRAIAFFERIGVRFNPETAKPVAIYFADDIGGFAIHLVQK